MNLRLLPAPLAGVERGDSHTWLLPLLSTVHLALTYAVLSDFSDQDHVSVLPKIPTGESHGAAKFENTPCRECEPRELAKERRVLGFTLTQHWGLWGLPGPCRRLSSIPGPYQLDTNSSLPTYWTTKTVPTHGSGTNDLAEPTVCIGTSL